MVLISSLELMLLIVEKKKIRIPNLEYKNGIRHLIYVKMI